MDCLNLRRQHKRKENRNSTLHHRASSATRRASSTREEEDGAISVETEAEEVTVATPGAGEEERTAS